MSFKLHYESKKRNGDRLIYLNSLFSISILNGTLRSSRETFSERIEGAQKPKKSTEFHPVLDFDLKSESSSDMTCNSSNRRTLIFLASLTRTFSYWRCFPDFSKSTVLCPFFKYYLINKIRILIFSIFTTKCLFEKLRYTSNKTFIVNRLD